MAPVSNYENPTCFFTSTNKLMDASLRDLAAYLDDGRAGFNGNVIGLVRLLQTKVVIHQGCYLLGWGPGGLEPQPDAEFVPDRMHPDRTGVECFENHQHVTDLLQYRKRIVQPGNHYLGIGLLVAEILRLKLALAFPDVRFRIIVSFPVRSIGPGTYPGSVSSATVGLEQVTMYDCIVRFHAVRQGEVIYDDLENFKTEAIGVVEFCGTTKEPPRKHDAQ